MAFSFPKIYPILDSAVIPQAGRAEFLRRLGGEMADAGVTLLEYRNKTGSEAELLADAAILRAALPPARVKLILDDRADLVAKAGFDGVHVDAGDISPAEARRMMGPEPHCWYLRRQRSAFARDSEGACGLSVDWSHVPDDNKTNNQAPDRSSRRAASCAKQAGAGAVLVAVGGITLAKAADVLAAGASAVAVSAAIFRAPNPAAEFRLWMAALEPARSRSGV